MVLRVHVILRGPPLAQAERLIEVLLKISRTNFLVPCRGYPTSLTETSSNKNFSNFNKVQEIHLEILSIEIS